MTVTIERRGDLINPNLDPSSNDRHATVISVPDSACTVHVMQADENLMIARHTWALLGGRA